MKSYLLAPPSLVCLWTWTIRTRHITFCRLVVQSAGVLPVENLTVFLPSPLSLPSPPPPPFVLPSLPTPPPPSHPSLHPPPSLPHTITPSHSSNSLVSVCQVLAATLTTEQHQRCVCVCVCSSLEYKPNILLSIVLTTCEGVQ